MPEYRKKPVVIEARQWDGTAEGATPIIDWALRNGGTINYDGPTPAAPDCPTPEYHDTHHYCPSCSFSDSPEHLSINTLEGRLTASPDDYIIKGMQNEFYACKPDIFDITYELDEAEDYAGL